MGDRIDEVVGNTKETIGDLIGNEDMEREGQSQADRAKLEREVDGAVDKTVGKAQETWGKVTGDKETELAGKVRHIEGSVQQGG
jgi:uncharacterized protein YjbJ (UPF0337 family)